MEHAQVMNRISEIARNMSTGKCLCSKKIAVPSATVGSAQRFESLPDLGLRDFLWCKRSHKTSLP
jgi:hypothetical protein